MKIDQAGSLTVHSGSEPPNGLPQAGSASEMKTVKVIDPHGGSAVGWADSPWPHPWGYQANRLVFFASFDDYFWRGAQAVMRGA